MDYNNEILTARLRELEDMEDELFQIQAGGFVGAAEIQQMDAIYAKYNVEDPDYWFDNIHLVEAELARRDAA